MKTNAQRIVSKIMIFSLMVLLTLPHELHTRAAEDKSYTEQVSITTVKSGDSYSIKRLERRITYRGDLTIVIYYEYPQLKGSTTNIKAFNTKMKKKANSYMSEDSVRWLLDWRDDSIENGRDDIPYYCKTSTRLTYKSGNRYSFRTEERWYGGGVLNISRSGINYNKKTGKYPQVSDFVAGNVNEKLVKKLKAVYPELATTKNIKYIRNKKKFSYYLQNGKAVVCFQPDALDQGLSYLSLGLKMK